LSGSSNLIVGAAADASCSCVRSDVAACVSVDVVCAV
jgi:hypothetical protein